MTKIAFSKPIGLLPANTPIVIDFTDDTTALLELAAAEGLTPHIVVEKGIHPTQYRRAGGKSKGYCPIRED